jgi:hypothetical protein
MHWVTLLASRNLAPHGCTLGQLILKSYHRQGILVPRWLRGVTSRGPRVPHVLLTRGEGDRVLLLGRWTGTWTEVEARVQRRLDGAVGKGAVRALTSRG